MENRPDYIESAIKLGYCVEVDVRLFNYGFYTGHDSPQYEVSYDWFFKRIDNLWLHCKNIECLSFFIPTRLHCFWHETDTITLTNKKFIWAFPGRQPIKNSIAVLPELNNDDISQCIGICSDVIANFK